MGYWRETSCALAKKARTTLVRTRAPAETVFFMLLLEGASAA
jgi:hypothetical protein